MFDCTNGECQCSGTTCGTTGNVCDGTDCMCGGAAACDPASVTPACLDAAGATPDADDTDAGVTCKVKKG